MKGPSCKGLRDWAFVLVICFDLFLHVSGTLVMRCVCRPYFNYIKRLPPAAFTQENLPAVIMSTQFSWHYSQCTWRH